MSGFPVLHVDPNTASSAELKQAAKTLQAARFVAECREHGHDHTDLRPTPEFDDAGHPVVVGDPTGIRCSRCGATWTVTSEPA